MKLANQTIGNESIFTNGRTGLSRLVAVSCLVGIFFCTVSHSIFAQGGGHAFRSFTRSATPRDLNRLLGTDEAVRDKLVSDKIAEMVLKKFATLTPEQQKRLAELSSDFAQGQDSFDLEQKREDFERVIRDDPELRKAAEEIRSAFEGQQFGNNSIDRRQIEQGIRREVEDRMRRELQSRRFNDSGTQSESGTFSNNPFNNSSPNSSPPFNGTDIDSEPQMVPGINRPPGQNSPNNIPETSPEGGFPNSPFSQGFSNRPTPGDPEFNSNLDPGQGLVPNDPSNPGESGNQNNIQSPQQSGPFGGFSDSGESAPESSSGSSVGSASGENESLPDESLGHKFNRMVLKSLENAMEKQVGAEENGQKGSFRRLLDQFVEKMSNSNPEVASNFNGAGREAMEWIGNRMSSSRGRFNSSNFLSGIGGNSRSFGGGMNLSVPAVSPGSVMIAILVVGGIVALFYFGLKKGRLAHYFGLRTEDGPSGLPPEFPAEFKDYDEVVQLIDQFTLWLFGKKASWWNSKIVQREVESYSPELGEEVRFMMKVYDFARYAKSDQSVAFSDVSRIKQTLDRLKQMALEQTTQSSGRMAIPKTHPSPV